MTRLGGGDAPPEGERRCLSAGCALALEHLFGEPREPAERAMAAAFAAIPGAATFANARVVLARLFRVDAEVVSGRLDRLLALSGREGLLLLGVNPRMLYARAAPGRHAVLLASCLSAPPPWGARVLDVERAPPEAVTVADPAAADGSRSRVSLAQLERAFDGAGREALLVKPVRLERAGSTPGDGR